MSAILLSALVNGAIVSLVLGGVLWLVFRLMGHRFWNASMRYGVWLMALAVTVAVPLVHVGFQLREPEPLQLEGVPGPAQLPLPGTTAPSSSGARFGEDEGSDEFSQGLFPALEVPAGPWTTWILALWGVAGGVMLARLIVSYVWLSRRKARASQAFLDSRSRVWMAQYGSARRVGVSISDEVSIPMAAGPFKPCILLPAHFVEALHEDELEQVGLHEAAHFARRDDWVLLLQRLVEVVFVFHPVVRWISASLDVERELACDDMVVASTGRPRPYAQCLTRVAELANGLTASPLAAPVVEVQSVLERRVDMILDKSRERYAPPSMKTRFALVLVLLASGVWIVSAAPQFVALETEFAGASTATAAQPARAPGEGAPETPQNPQIVAGQAEAASKVNVTLNVQEKSPNEIGFKGGVSGIGTSSLGLTATNFLGFTAANLQSQQEEARDNLNRGVQAFQAKDVQTAITFFGRAAELNPNLTAAHIYLATAYTSLVVPGQPETAEYGARAIRIFEGVLKGEPSNAEALSGLAVVYQRRGEMRKARDEFLKAAKAGTNSSVLYSIGALDWYLVYDKVAPPAPAEQAFLIDEGLDYLDKALAMDPLYEDAMTYKNLLLREKARLAQDPNEKARLSAQADDWFNKALQTRQQRVASQQPRSLPTGNALSALPPPPPPPPPPSPRPGQASATGQVPAPFRIGGDVAQANLIFQVRPEYPADARAARVQDYVMLQAIINKDGVVQDLKILRGHPLLNDAATSAVKQWRYRPQTLNGQAIDVITTITVNFSFR